MKKIVFVAAGYLITQLSAEVLADELIENNNDIIADKDEINIDDIAAEIVENSNISVGVEKEYREIITKFYENGIQLDISLEEYAEIAGECEEINYDEYVIEKDESDDANIELYSSGSGEYYYNYDEKKGCPDEVNYTGTRLLSMASAGNVLYEREGFGGLTGHVAIVEGRFYDASKKKYYIRVVESRLGYGVTRGILDSTRYQHRGGSLLLFASGINVSSDVRKKAVDFAVKQIGKGYSKSYWRKGYDPNQSSWYCSELVWASYYSQGVDIEKKGINGVGITPRDIYNSEKLVAVNVYK